MREVPFFRAVRLAGEPALPAVIERSVKGRLHNNALALGYVLAIVAAEMVTAFGSRPAGLVMHCALLAALLVHCALSEEKSNRRLFVGLALAPVIRINSLALPLAGVLPVYRYLVASGPLLAMALVLIRVLGLSRWDLGLHRAGIPLQLAVGLTGAYFGYLFFGVEGPAPLIAAPTIGNALLPALILFFCTGFLEELLFRGILQKVATEALGPLGLCTVALLSAVLQSGARSALSVSLAFGAALFFGWVVVRTRSLIGVALAHGLANILLFLVLPFYAFSGGPAGPVPPATAATSPMPTPTAAGLVATQTPETMPTSTPTEQPSGTPSPTAAPSNTPEPEQTPTRTAEASATPTEVPATPTSTTAAGEATQTPTPEESLTPTIVATLLSPTPERAGCSPPSDWVLYRVRPGESINLLVQRHHISAEALIRANCLTRTTLLIDQRLYLPPLATATPKATAQHQP